MGKGSVKIHCDAEMISHSYRQCFWSVSTLIAVLLVSGGCSTSSAPAPACASSVPQGESASCLLTVAAASDLRFSLPEVISTFQKLHPSVLVRVTYGASGTLMAQIENGSPVDVFLSADRAYPQKLIASGRGVSGTDFTYARGRVVLWVRNASPLDLQSASDMKILLDPSIQKIALANSEHAPYGQSAMAALKHYQLDEPLKDRLVLGENVAQAAQFVESGAADVGLIALSLALSPSMKERGRNLEIPLEAYPPLLQGGVILSQSNAQTAAKLFCDFLISAEGQKILHQSGFHHEGHP